MKIHKLIGVRVAYFRKIRGYTQEELAGKIHISVSSLSKIECGKYNKNISVGMLDNISKGLGVTVVMLLSMGEKDEKVFLESRGGI